MRRVSGGPRFPHFAASALGARPCPISSLACCLSHPTPETSGASREPPSRLCGRRLTAASSAPRPPHRSSHPQNLFVDPYVARPSVPDAGRDPCPSRLHERESVDVEKAAVGELEVRDHRERQEGQLQEGLRQRAAEFAAARTSASSSWTTVSTGLRLIRPAIGSASAATTRPSSATAKPPAARDDAFDGGGHVARVGADHP